jgi:chromosome partitioning protein
MAERAKWDTVIVDAGGQDSAELRLAVAACDVLVVPVKPALFDTWAMSRMAQVIKAARETGREFRAMSVIAAADTRTKEARELHPILTDEYGDVMPPLDVVLFERVAYRLALREGKGLADGTEDQKALEEFTRLYRSIFNDD